MRHRDLTLIHRIENWQFANQAAREGLVGALAEDVDKIAYQLDNNTYWRLTDHSPLTWIQAMAGPAGADGADGADGTNGTNGTDGADGADGAPGVGVPTGGTTGQVLTKASGTDYDTQWETPTGGGSGDIPLSMPQGTLQRQYSFNSSIEGWVGSGGTPTIVSNALQLAYTGDAIEPVGASNIADGEVYFDRLINTGSEASICFRATDVNNFYMFQLFPSATVQFYKRVGGVMTNLVTAGAMPYIHTSNWNKVLVRFVGSVFELWINGGFIGSYTDTTFTTGRIVVHNQSGASRYRNLKIYSF